MGDFLDGDLGEFDWGPRRRNRVGVHRAGRRQQLQGQRLSGDVDSGRLARYVVMASVGAATLAIGAASAWTSYTQTAGAATAPAPPAATQAP